MHMHDGLGLRTATAKLIAVPAFEYRRATWDEVCQLGPQGWRIVPVPPIVEMRQVLGQMQAGEPLYVIERETSRHDGAVAAITAAPGQLARGQG